MITQNHFLSQFFRNSLNREPNNVLGKTIQKFYRKKYFEKIECSPYGVKNYLEMFSFFFIYSLDLDQ